MQVKKWMAALMVAGSLCAGAVMAAEAEAAKNQPALKESAAADKGAAALGEQSDDCPMHKPNKDAVQGGMGKDGEPCPYPHDKVHMGAMNKAHDGCDPHDKKKCAGEKECAEKHGEKCKYEHDAKLEHEACDPAKHVASTAKLPK
jgi:hypothetical protein